MTASSTMAGSIPVFAVAYLGGLWQPDRRTTLVTFWAGALLRCILNIDLHTAKHIKHNFDHVYTQALLLPTMENLYEVIKWIRTYI